MEGPVLRPESPKSFLHPRALSQGGPRFTRKHSWGSSVSSHHLPDNTVQGEGHSPPCAGLAGLRNLRDLTPHEVPGKAGTCSEQTACSVPVPLAVQVINARCHSLADRQTGHRELGLLWEASPCSLSQLPCPAMEWPSPPPQF